MRLTVVGCAGLFPGPSSAASCYLIESSNSDEQARKVLIDLGNGAISALQRIMDPVEIDAVLLSNLELDHCADFSALYVILAYGPSHTSKPIPLYGPPRTLERLVEISDKHGGRTGILDFFSFSELSDAFSLQIGSLTATPYRVDHPTDSFGFRITENSATLAYTGDTDICPALYTLADGASLLLADATLCEQQENSPAGHMTGRRAGALATQASVENLVLTHLPVWTEPAVVLAEATTIYAGHAEVAKPGRSYEL